MSVRMCLWLPLQGSLARMLSRPPAGNKTRARGCAPAPRSPLRRSRRRNSRGAPSSGYLHRQGRAWGMRNSSASRVASFPQEQSGRDRPGQLCCAQASLSALGSRAQGSWPRWGQAPGPVARLCLRLPCAVPPARGPPLCDLEPEDARQHRHHKLARLCPGPQLHPLNQPASQAQRIGQAAPGKLRGERRRLAATPPCNGGQARVHTSAAPGQHAGEARQRGACLMAVRTRPLRRMTSQTCTGTAVWRDHAGAPESALPGSTAIAPCSRRAGRPTGRPSVAHLFHGVGQLLVLCPHP